MTLRQPGLEYTGQIRIAYNVEFNADRMGLQWMFKVLTSHLDARNPLGKPHETSFACSLRGFRCPAL